MQSLRFYVLIGFLFSLCAPLTAFGQDCLICHSSMKGRMESRKGGVIVNVHIDADRFSASSHGRLNCTDCHMNYTGTAHFAPSETEAKDIAELLPSVSLKAKIDPYAMAACSRCHPDVYKEYIGSVHGQNIFKKKETDGPICTDCHGAPHYIVPKTDKDSMVNHANMLHTCGKCHEDTKITEKYHLSEYVIEKYKESFHGKKYLLGHKKVPICNDCHGSHKIVKIDDPNSPVAGSGKAATCGKCHKGAGEKFAAAPAHKHLTKDNPIPFYGEKLLIMLLLGTFAFIVSHVILEAYSEIRDSVFRKKEDKHD